MTTAVTRSPAESASQKVATGALMTLGEVAAMLDLAPATIHRLPLPSIRIGKSLRFDPVDVRRLIESSKEPAICN
jgi:hypothetical protein